MLGHSNRDRARPAVKDDIVLAIGNMYEFNEKHNYGLDMSTIVARRKQKENFAVSAELALFWGGRISSRLVITPRQPDPLLVDTIAERLGVEIRTLVPRLETGWVCRDLLSDQVAFARLIEVLRSYTVHIVPWGATLDMYRLVEALREHGICVGDTEFSSCDARWVAAFLDSKIGARSVIDHASSNLTRFSSPDGYICHGRDQAAPLAQRLASRWGNSIVIKSNRGAGGRGVRVFLPVDASLFPDRTLEEFRAAMEDDDLWRDVPIIVEEMVGARTGVSALTFEGIISSCGEVIPKGVGNLLIGDHRFYLGTEMGRGAVVPEIASSLSEIGVEIGKQIRALGYLGWFDVDVLHPNGRDHLYGSEINPRRTGPTPLIELAERIDGPNWKSRRFYRITERLWLARPINGFAELHDTFRRVHERIACYGAGVAPISSQGVSLQRPYAGYIIYASTREDADEIEADLRHAMASSATFA